MPNSDKGQNSSKQPINQILAHESEIIELLQPEAQTCPFHAAALDLVRHGLRVHPLRPRDKIPRFKGWQDLASSNPDTIDQWAKDHPEANVGIVPGEASGVFILDCDLRHGAYASLDKFKRLHGEWPLTWTALTPNGWHLYFQHPGGRVRNYALDAGLEVKGDKGNVVGPGSIHPGGLSYRWQPYCSPNDIPLAQAPNWLLELLERKHKWMPAGEVRPDRCQVNILGPSGVLAEASGKAGSLSRADILAFFSNESIIKKCLPLFGLGEIEIGEKFHCVLHPENRESASILRPEREGDPYMYMDFHEHEGGRKAFPLPLVYYALKRGKPGEPIRDLPKPSFTVWALRLLRDAGVISPVRVQGPRLPDNVKPAIRKAYEGYKALLGLKYLMKREDSPYTWRFTESWVAIGRKAASGAIRWLLATGYLQCVGTYGTDEAGNRVQLFRLGTRRLVDRLSMRRLLSLERGGQTEIIEAVDAEVAALEKEQQAADAAERALKLCRRCGETRDWVRTGDAITCLGCWQKIDTS